MGNSDSKAGGGGGADLSSPKNPEDKQKISKLAKADSTEIDPRIAKYLVERLKSPNREKSFMRIILKLPSIGDKFVKLQKAFEQFDSNGDGVIDEKELAGALKVLGANINEGQVRDIFASADVHTQNGLNIKSFIISLSLAYLFGVVPVQKDGSVQLSVMTSADQQGIKEAFAAGADMFLLFDEDAGGTITLDEVRFGRAFLLLCTTVVLFLQVALFAGVLKCPCCTLCSGRVSAEQDGPQRPGQEEHKELFHRQQFDVLVPGALQRVRLGF